ncbi:MAG: hypothetical protein A3F11_09120 [Gammaproteobacteria bacterium RIFCSPHIGHO2_12_FULL_37_14]|nr:MAG: hypothetical protein A3F11_09120 [Gammaproteobacteria bacterium RIFCSPHIGHO2_12_FULL_37_14]
MKKYIFFFLFILTNIQLIYAADTANIKIKIASPMNDNRYFMCVRNVGCMSIRAAKEGKIFPVMHTIEMDNIYIVNLKNNQLYSQGLPSSCSIPVKPLQTVTISGKLSTGSNNSARIDQLRCAIS